MGNNKKPIEAHVMEASTQRAGLQDEPLTGIDEYVAPPTEGFGEWAFVFPRKKVR